MIEASTGQVVGKLATKVERLGPIRSGHVTGLMVRTKARTDPKYLDSVRSEIWEVVLAELVLESPGEGSPRGYDIDDEDYR